MKPVAIFRHFPSEGPGYFATFLDRHSLPWQLIAIDEGEQVPAADAFSGLVFMGGPMSVNDDLPWIPPLLELIRQAVARDIPVLGHCLGGQLISKALGGTVGRNPVKEIGWGDVRIVPSGTATEWFGDLAGFHAFHWHGETFSIPAGATRVLESDYCVNQAFALGPHFGFQCHVEMLPEMIASWCVSGERELAHGIGQPSVQQAGPMQEKLAPKLEAMRAVADRVYAKWIKNLKL